MNSCDVKLNIKLVGTLSSVLYIPAGEILASTGITTGTFYRIKNNPEILTIQQLLSIANGLHVPVRHFFYTGNTYVIGHRDDYITEPYLECSYNSERLQEFVSNTDSATWKHASEILGITRDNLRNSLLGARRTPVMRFLQVCAIFGINPFTILVDPNPDCATKSGRHTKPAQPASNDELTKLRHDLNILSDTIADLTRKYDALIHQFDEMSNTSRGVHMHIVAEDIPDPTPED